MKEAIHPNYVVCNVTCGCGNKFVTRSVKPQIHVEVCSACHPYYTGKQRFVDTAGRVEKFQRRHNWDDTSKDKMVAVKEDTKLVPIAFKTAVRLPKTHKKSKEAAEAEQEFLAKESRNKKGPGGFGGGGGRGDRGGFRPRGAPPAAAGKPAGEGAPAAPAEGAPAAASPKPAAPKAEAVPKAEAKPASETKS